MSDIKGDNRAHAREMDGSCSCGFVYVPDPAASRDERLMSYENAWIAHLDEATNDLLPEWLLGSILVDNVRDMFVFYKLYNTVGPTEKVMVQYVQLHSKEIAGAGELDSITSLIYVDGDLIPENHPCWLRVNEICDARSSTEDPTPQVFPSVTVK